MKKRILSLALALSMALALLPTAAWAAKPMDGETGGQTEVVEAPPEAAEHPRVSPRTAQQSADEGPAVDEDLQIEVVEPSEAQYDAGYSATLTVPGEWDSYDWQLWAGQAEGWLPLDVTDPTLPLSKELFVSCAFRCVVEKDGAQTVSAPYAYDGSALETSAGAGANLLASAQEPWRASEYVAVADAGGSGKCFDLYGIENGSYYKTTYSNGGYTIASEVDGTRLRWNAGPNQDVSMGESLTGRFGYDIVYGGRYAKITYQVTNNGSTEKEFKIGSSGDVMIDKNDKAEVVGTDMGLQMDDKAGKKFNLAVPNATTRWYGSFASAYSNTFTDLADKTVPYTGDSGMAWSWTGTVKPGKTWTRSALVGVGELPPAINNPTVAIAYKNGWDFVTPGGTFAISGTAAGASEVYIDLAGVEHKAAVSGGTFSTEITVPDDAPEGPLELQAWAVNDVSGALSNTTPGSVKVRHAPHLDLTVTETWLEEEETPDESWYTGFVRSHHGNLAHEPTTIDTNATGDKTVTYTVTLEPFTPVTRPLTVHVLPKPAQLSQAAATQSGENFDLSAKIVYTGDLTFRETGFVYGAFQNPNLDFNDGKVASSPAANGKGTRFSATATGLIDGVVYYARAYAIDSAGTVLYGPQSTAFGPNAPQYGTFSVECTRYDSTTKKTTFTISRTGGSEGEQKVHYRTVNGSAVGDMYNDDWCHFFHADGVLTFGAGETSKTVEVTEYGPNVQYGYMNAGPATKYSNADRTYQMEIHRVVGGASIGTRFATRNMGHDTGYEVSRDCYVPKRQGISGNTGNVVAQNGGAAENEPSYISAFSVDRFHTQDLELEYLKATASKYEMRMYVKVNEETDCWEWLRFSSGGENAVVKFELNPYGNDGVNREGWLPWPVGNNENGNISISEFPNMSPYTSTADSRYVFGFDINASPIDVAIATTGEGDNKWTLLTGCEQESMYSDVEGPQLEDLPFLARHNSTAAYLPGDPIKLSLIFNEIVDEHNSFAAGLNSDSYITTNWGKLYYAGGADTNILYFTGTTPDNPPPTGDGNLKLLTVDCANQIKDMAGNSCTGISSPFTTTVLSSTNPGATVGVGTITNVNGTLSAQITASNADRLEYAWTQSSATPTSGWRRLTNTSGERVTTRQTSGTWYLHAQATNVDGARKTDVKSFSIPEPGQPDAPALPTLTATADNAAWAQKRTITLTKSPGDASVTCTGKPSGATATASGGNFVVDRNGTYTFRLTSNGETVTAMATVSKLDLNPPTVTIDALDSNRTYIEPVTLTVHAADADSDLKSVTGTWSNGSKNVTATFTGSDGVYTATSPNETGAWTLNVTVTDNVDRTAAATAAYTLNLNVPTVTVTKGSANANGSVNYTYSVDMKGQGVQGVQLPDGTVTDALTGSFTLTEPGTYYVVVSDTVGHVVRSDAMVVSPPPSGQPAIDGQPPEVRLTPSTEAWVSKETGVTVTVNAYDNIAPTSAAWKLGSGTAKSVTLTADTAAGVGVRAKTGSFKVTANGTYTVTAKDARNNVGTAEIEITNIDSAAPTITDLAGNPTNWTPDDAAITFNVADTQSGVKSVAVKKGSADVTVTNNAGACSFTADANGDYVITVTDNVGYTATQTVTVEKIDKTTPGLTVSGGATAAASLELTVTATSSGPSGVSTTVSKDGGTVQEVTGGTYTVDAAGQYVFTATTGAGVTKSQTVTIRSITFDETGGVAVTDQIVVSGGKATQPTITRTGYTFGGWKNGTTAWDFASNTVTGNTTLTAQWTLDAPTVAVKATPENATATYTGSPVVTLTATPSHDAAGLRYTYQWYKGAAKLEGKTDNTLSLTTVAESGDYTVVVTASDGTLTSAEVESAAQSVTIGKTAPVLSDLSATDITYGDPLSASRPSGKATDPETGVALTGDWSWTSATAGTTYPTVVTDSGKTEYTVTFTPSDSKNYGPATATVKLTVNKATLTPSVDTVADKVYDGGTGTNGTIKLDGAQFDDVPAATGTFNFNSANVTEANAVNVTDIALTGDWGGNYVLSGTSLSGVSTTARITPKTVSLTWSGHENLVYDRQPVSVTATAGSLVGEDVCTVTVTGGTQTNAGTYTATATSLNNPNYQLPEGVTQAYTIAKCPVAFTVTHNDLDYHHGGHPNADVTAPGLTKDTEFTVSYRQTGQVIEPHFSGTYDVMVQLTDPNFKFQGQDDDCRELKVGELTIHHVSYEGAITWPTASNSITYGQPLSEVKFAGGSGSTEGGEGTFAWDAPDSFPDAATTKAVMVFDPEDPEYDPVEYDVAIQVNKATLTPSVASVADKVYDGNTDATGTLTLAGAQFDDAPAATGVFDFMDKNAAKSKAVNVTAIALTDSWNANYVLPTEALSAIPTAAKITPKPITLTWGGYQDLVYSGKSVNVTATAGDLVEGDTCAVTVTGGDAVNAGSHTAEATALSDPNYQLPAGAIQTYTIAPKPVTLLWHNMIQPYTGADRTPKAVTELGSESAVTLHGVVPQDDGTADFIAAVTQNGQSAQAVNAGTYTVTGAMKEGSNYVVTGYHSAQLTVQKAPVTFAVTDNTLKEGEPRHAATVTADPANVPFTVVYKDRDGQVVDPETQDLKAGAYPIWVTITDGNYHHAGSATGDAAQIGVFTVYAQDPPKKYTVTFAAADPEDETGADGGVIGVLSGSTEPLAAAEADTLRVLPDCTYTCTGYAFAGWELDGKLYPAGAAYTQEARDVAFTARWAKAVHTVEGVVDQDGKPISDVQVTLMLGANVIAQRHTDAAGKFRFENIAPGLYNLVVTKDGVTMTVAVTIVDQDEARNITLPTHKTNSVVVVAPGTPSVVVGNLENNFTPEDNALAAADVSTEVEYKFTVQQEPENEQSADQQAIQEAAGRATPGLYLELTLEKTVTQGDSVTTSAMPESNVLLESVIPLPAELQGKYRYSVIRCHGEGADAQVQELEEDTPNDGGEYFKVNEDRTVLTIYARKFSTYAVAHSGRHSGAIAYGSGTRPVCTGGGACPIARFTDSDPKVWYHDGVHYCLEKGLMVGTSETTFEPGTDTSRAMIATILWRLQGSKTVNYAIKYDDVAADAWYTEAVRWATSEGIVTGYGNGSFGPNDAITREQLATMLYRYEQKYGKGGFTGMWMFRLDFQDVDQISEWAYEALCWMTMNDVITGKTDKVLDPKGQATRAEAATMLQRYIQSADK